MILQKRFLPLYTHEVLTFMLLSLIPIIGFMSIDIFFPSLPAVAHVFHISESKAQLCIGAYLLSFGLSQLIYGPLSDYFGRRPVLLLGFLIYCVGSMISLIHGSFSLLVFARFLQGAGIGAGATLCRVILRDLRQGDHMAQMSSFLSIAVVLASTLAPGLGGLLQQSYGYQGNLWFMLLAGILAFLLLSLFLIETRASAEKDALPLRSIMRTFREILRNKSFLYYVTLTGFAFLILTAYASVNPFILQVQYHFSAARYGLIAILISAGELLGTFINSAFVLKFGLNRMLLVGMVLILIAGSVLLYPTPIRSVSLLKLIACSFLATVGIAFIFPNASAGAFSSFKEHIGTVGAAYGAIQILFATAMSLILSVFHLTHAVALGAIFIITSLVGLFLTFCRRV